MFSKLPKDLPLYCYIAKRFKFVNLSWKILFFVFKFNCKIKRLIWHHSGPWLNNHFQNAKCNLIQYNYVQLELAISIENNLCLYAFLNQQMMKFAIIRKAKKTQIPFVSACRAALWNGSAADSIRSHKQSLFTFSCFLWFWLVI